MWDGRRLEGPGAWFARVLLMVSIALTVGSCFVVSWLPGRRESTPPVAGPAPYVEGCKACHAAPVGAHYPQSLHAAKGIRCGQCHTPAGHPNYRQPVRDATCGGCHLPQYEQTLASKLGGDPRRDVVDSRGRSWDVDGLYVADSSILPTSLGVNPCYTVYALGRYIAHNIVEEIRASTARGPRS